MAVQVAKEKTRNKNPYCQQGQAHISDRKNYTTGDVEPKDLALQQHQLKQLVLELRANINVARLEHEGSTNMGKQPNNFFGLPVGVLCLDAYF